MVLTAVYQNYYFTTLYRKLIHTEAKTSVHFITEIPNLETVLAS